MSPFRSVLIALISLFATSCAAAAEFAEAKPGEVLWKFVAPHNRTHNIVFPRFHNGQAFLVCSTPSYPRQNATEPQNFVYRLDPKKGTVLWESDLGNVTCSEPAIGGGKLIVSTCDPMLTSSKAMCLDVNDGKLLWERDFGEWRVNNFGGYNNPTICGDQVVLMANRCRTGLVRPDYSRLICLELKDGYEVWSASDPFTGMFSRLTPAIDGKVFFGMDNVDPRGHITANMLGSFNPTTGKLTEEQTFAVNVRPPAPPVSLFWLHQPAIADVQVYMSERQGFLSCYPKDKKSDPLWQVKIGDGSCQPVATEGRVLISQSSGDVICFRARDGKELWKTYVGTFLSVPALYNNQVVVCTRQSVTALRLDNGAKLWDYYLDRPLLDGTPSVADGIVLVPLAYNRDNVSIIALKIAEKIPPP